MSFPSAVLYEVLLNCVDTTIEGIERRDFQVQQVMICRFQLLTLLMSTHVILINKSSAILFQTFYESCK